MTATTRTEYGVEMTAMIMGSDVTKVFPKESQAEAEGDASYRSTLKFVRSARVVRREVTVTSWESP